MESRRLTLKTRARRRCGATECRAVGQLAGVGVYARKLATHELHVGGRLGMPRALRPKEGGNINAKVMR